MHIVLYFYRKCFSPYLSVFCETLACFMWWKKGWRTWEIFSESFSFYLQNKLFVIIFSPSENVSDYFLIDCSRTILSRFTLLILKTFCFKSSLAKDHVLLFLSIFILLAFHKISEVFFKPNITKKIFEDKESKVKQKVV